MNDSSDLISRIVVRSDAGGLTAPPLIDGHIDDDGSRFHTLHNIVRKQFGCCGTRNEHATNNEVCGVTMTLDQFAGRVDSVEWTSELSPKSSENIDILIDDPDFSTHADSDVNRMCTDNSAAEDHDLCRVNTRNAAEKHTQSAVRLFEEASSSLNRHTSSDFRHRRKKWEAARWRRDGLIGYARRTGLEQIARLFSVGREMQIRK